MEQQVCQPKPVRLLCWQWNESVTTSQAKPWNHVPEWVEDLIPHWGRMWLFVPIKNAAGGGITLYSGDWMVKDSDKEVRVVSKDVFPTLYDILP